MLGLEIFELAVFLVRVVANVTVEHAITDKAFANAVALRLLAQEVLRVYAVLAALALVVTRCAFFVCVHGRPREKKACLNVIQLDFLKAKTYKLI